MDDGPPTRWIIDFAQREMTEAMHYQAAFERVKKLVMPDVLAKAEKEKKATGKDSTRWTRMANRWWQFRDYQPGTMAAICESCRATSPAPVLPSARSSSLSLSPIHPDNALVVFPFADDYSFGILQSGIHWAWFTAKCSTLTARFRYTSDTVFDTFPWPQSPTLAQVKAVAEAAVSLRALRREIMAANGWSLRDLYRTLETPGTNRLRDAHAALDSAVRAAYGMKEKEDPLAFLLRLNLELAGKEASSEPITPPGLPPRNLRPRGFCHRGLHSNAMMFLPPQPVPRVCWLVSRDCSASEAPPRVRLERELAADRPNGAGICYFHVIVCH